MHVECEPIWLGDSLVIGVEQWEMVMIIHLFTFESSIFKNNPSVPKHKQNKNDKLLPNLFSSIISVEKSEAINSLDSHKKAINVKVIRTP